MSQTLSQRDSVAGNSVSANQPEATEPLTEYADSRGVTVRVDAASGVLRGVKLIGLHSKNGRRYRESTLREAAPLYEGAKVNVNHPAGGPLTPRDYRDRLGVIRNVEFTGSEESSSGPAAGGLVADLHFNPKHALAEQLVWDAQHNPKNVGFSHNVLARLSRDGEETVVEEITHVQSVDLVADPATTQGLFEAKSPSCRQTKCPQCQCLHEPCYDALTVETLRLHRPDLLEEAEQVIQEQLTKVTDKADRVARELLFVQLAQQYGLSSGRTGSLEESLGEQFYAILLNASDEDVPALLAERAALSRRPQSVDPSSLVDPESSPIASAAEFATAIKGNG
ncbi:MAG: hypothetical protein RH917_19340 [Lacipirellulaceae bacterium]